MPTESLSILLVAIKAGTPFTAEAIGAALEVLTWAWYRFFAPDDSPIVATGNETEGLEIAKDVGMALDSEWEPTQGMTEKELAGEICAMLVSMMMEYIARSGNKDYMDQYLDQLLLLEYRMVG